MWDKKDDLNEKVYLDILVGEHVESAFVEIKTEMVFIINLSNLLLGLSEIK